MTATTPNQSPDQSPNPSSHQSDDKTIVRDYFNATGFDRWRRIYGEDEVNVVQRNIRKGHQKTVDTVLEWLNADGNLKDLTLCDAGCGVGSLSIPLAQAGAKVSASDISEKMVEEAKDRATALNVADHLTFSVQDLESLSGQYHTVVCLDVLIHYPQDEAARMIQHLSSCAEHRLLLSFAPYTCAYNVLKKVGSFFPGASKATRAYLHHESEIVKILNEAGWQVGRTAMNKAPFYFSRLIEAVKA
ncbi:MAG: magnesium protoporphyrin IX methyltransferase [Oculatellaceae cyanobacterium Prado106]|jgi:magnesium-protoporphyrin O-methyltransferase|nr:magnesium protoporphyrin IX methyltransferase [Oculatellaceae cyanobacterium Prado106]